MRRRSLKSQIQGDAKRVFMNLDEFAVLEHIRYYPSDNKPPVDMRIPVVVNEDESGTQAWYKSRSVSYAGVGNDQTLYRVNKVLYCAWEDFNPQPRNRRKIQVGNYTYTVYGVEVQGGLLKIGLLAMDE